MKTKLAIAALALTLSNSVVAYNPQGSDEFCEDIRVGAQNAMEFRQRGYGLDVATSIDSSFFDPVTVEAYHYPIFPDTYVKAKIIMAFGDQVYLSCMSGGIEFDANNVMQFIK